MSSREIATAEAMGFDARRRQLAAEAEATLTAARAAHHGRVLSRSWLDAAEAEGLTPVELAFFTAPVVP